MRVQIIDNQEKIIDPITGNDAFAQSNIWAEVLPYWNRLQNDGKGALDPQINYKPGYFIHISELRRFDPFARFQFEEDDKICNIDELFDLVEKTFAEAIEHMKQGKPVKKLKKEHTEVKAKQETDLPW